MALFPTVDQVLAAERAQRVQNFGSNPGAVVQGALGSLGFSLGNRLLGASGLDVRSQPQRDAAKIQQIVQGIDFNDMENVVDRANALANAGFMAQSQALMQRLPRATDNWSKPFTRTMTIENEDGSTETVRFLSQVNMATNKEDILGQIKTTRREGKGLGADWNEAVRYGGTKLDTTHLRQLSALPSVQRRITGGKADPEALAPLLGVVETVANQLKDEARNRLTLTFGNDRVLERVGAPDDTLYLQEALALVLESGFANDLVDHTALFTGEADIPADLSVNLDELRARQQRHLQSSQVEEEFDFDATDIPRRDKRAFPRSFSFETASRGQVADVFKSLRKEGGEKKTLNDIQEEFEARGFTFGGEQLEGHQIVWTNMLENEPFVVEYVNSSKEDRDRLLLDLEKSIRRRETTDDVLMKLELIKYLNQFKRDPDESPSPASFVDPLDLGA